MEAVASSSRGPGIIWYSLKVGIDSADSLRGGRAQYVGVGKLAYRFEYDWQSYKPPCLFVRCKPSACTAEGAKTLSSSPFMYSYQATAQDLAGVNIRVLPHLEGLLPSVAEFQRRH